MQNIIYRLISLFIIVWLVYWLIYAPLQMPMSYRDCGFGDNIFKLSKFDRWWAEITINGFMQNPAKMTLLVFGVPIVLYGCMRIIKNHGTNTGHS
ncbi:MAG: hypothetical protein ISR69_08625 [Gammaproteobacteria bacterium]|nr:hypothetical protein [Gammaproteobacteria bacterium]